MHVYGIMTFRQIQFLYVAGSTTQVSGVVQAKVSVNNRSTAVAKNMTKKVRQ